MTTEKKLTIGLVIWDLTVRGGTQRLFLEEARHLINKGHNVKIYAVFFNARKTYRDLVENMDINYIYEEKLPHKESLFQKLLHPLSNFKEYKSLMYLLSDKIDKKIDILNIHDFATYLLSGYFKTRNQNIPIVWTMNDIPLLQPHDLTLKEIIGAPLWNRRVYKNIPYIDEIVVLDEYNARRVKHFFGRKSVIIRSGIDISQFKFKEKKQSQILKIFFNGVFYPWRRYEDLIAALKILDDKKIDFEAHHIGTDLLCPEYAKKIYALVSAYKLNEKVHFHGAVSNSELVDMYTTSDIFVFPNSPQTWGLAVFEAMSCGTPVIVSTGSGASEILSDGENALLVPPKSPNKIAEAILRLKEDLGLWRRLSINGREFVEKNLKWEFYVDNILNLFYKILAREKLEVA